MSDLPAWLWKAPTRVIREWVAGQSRGLENEHLLHAEKIDPAAYWRVVKERDKARARIAHLVACIETAPCPYAHTKASTWPIAEFRGGCTQAHCDCWKRAALGEDDG